MCACEEENHGSQAGLCVGNQRNMDLDDQISPQALRKKLQEMGKSINQETKILTSDELIFRDFTTNPTRNSESLCEIIVQ